MKIGERVALKRELQVNASKRRSPLTTSGLSPLLIPNKILSKMKTYGWYGQTRIILPFQTSQGRGDDVQVTPALC